MLHNALLLFWMSNLPHIQHIHTILFTPNKWITTSHLPLFLPLLLIDARIPQFFFSLISYTAAAVAAEKLDDLFAASEAEPRSHKAHRHMSYGQTYTLCSPMWPIYFSLLSPFLPASLLICLFQYGPLHSTNLSVWMNSGFWLNHLTIDIKKTYSTTWK